MQSTFKPGDKVTFDSDRLDAFIDETSNIDGATDKYQELVISGAGSIGYVKEHKGNLTWVVFEDGWDLPIPTKYLKHTFNF